MDAARMHSILAAALVNPELLARWRQEPRLLVELGVAEGDVDLDALWKFAGLSEKIRHNTCRFALPLTFRLMSKLGLEIEIFGAYAGRAAVLRRAGNLPNEAKTEAFVGFLRDWVAPSIRERVMVLDLARHEAALAKLRGAALGETHVARPVDSDVTLDAIPVIRGVLILEASTFDPRAIAERVAAKEPDLSELAPGRCLLAYSWSGDSCDSSDGRILELDELAYALLSAADGATSVAALFARIPGGAALDAAVAIAFVRELASLGLVHVAPGGARKGHAPAGG